MKKSVLIFQIFVFAIFFSCVSQNSTDQKEKADIYYNLGNAYSELKQYNKAVEAYANAWSLDSELTAAGYNLIRVYIYLKKYDEAEQLLKELLGRDERNLLLLETAGYLAHNRGDYDEALRYYSNIVASFSSFVLKGMAKLDGLEIQCIAPSHGLLWRSGVQRIMSLYKRFAGYNTGGGCEKEICIIWGSMYGYTKQGLDAVIKGLETEGMPYTMHHIPDTDVSYILGNAYKAAGLVLAMPTYEYKMFPPMAYVLDLFERKHITDKTVLRLGSWGWSGGAQKEYEQKIEKLKWENIEPYEWCGTLTEADVTALTERGVELARSIKNQSVSNV